MPPRRLSPSNGVKMAATAFTGLNALWVKREKTALAETECRVKGAVMAGYCGGRVVGREEGGGREGREEKRKNRQKEFKMECRMEGKKNKENREERKTRKGSR